MNNKGTIYRSTPASPFSFQSKGKTHRSQYLLNIGPCNSTTPVTESSAVFNPGLTVCCT